MVPPPVAISNIAVGLITTIIQHSNAFIDRYDLKQEVRNSCYDLKNKLSDCHEKADDINKYISQHRLTEIWQSMTSEINESLENIKSRLQGLLESDGKRGNIFARPRRKFRQPYDVDKKLSGLIADVREIGVRLQNVQISNNEHAEANASTNLAANDEPAQLRESRIVNLSRDESASVQCVTSGPMEVPRTGVSQNDTASTETTTAYSVVSDVARGCKELVLYSSRALITLGNEALIRVQEALVAKAVADCSESLRLLGNKMWYFCGSNTLPTFVVKMALRHNPEAARRKIVDVLLSLSWLGKQDGNLGTRSEKNWVSNTTMDVSVVNALIIKRRYATRRRRAYGQAAIANEINSQLDITAADMVLVLHAMRQDYFVDQGLVIVSNGDQGLGWYRVPFLSRDGQEELERVPELRLEYVCSLENAGGGISSPADMKDLMILNFLHVTEMPPQAREVKEINRHRLSYMETYLKHTGNLREGEKAMFDADVKGYAYVELLEIACLHTLQAGYYARCQSFVDSLIETCDERQLVVVTNVGHRYRRFEEDRLMISSTSVHERMHLRQGKEIAFQLLAKEFYASVVEDARERQLLANCHDLYEYGRFCTQGEVMESWYDLLFPTVTNSLDVNFAQAALTGKGSYSIFVARSMSVRLRDSILLCDLASDSVAVAFDGVSEMSTSLKVRIGELVETTESQRLRASFLVCGGAVRVRKDTSTRMLDVMRGRYMGLQGIERISVNDVVEDLDEGELRNSAVLVECMESLAMQGGYRQDHREKSVFAALCSIRQLDKRMLVTGQWPPLFGEFFILRDGTSVLVQLDPQSKCAIVASKHGDVYRAQQICTIPSIRKGAHEYACVQ